MKYTKEYIQKVRLCSNLIEPPASQVIGELLDEIEKLQSENEWHKYPDEKPEIDGYYLVINQYGSMFDWMWRRGEWYLGCDEDNKLLVGITHWRPLPASPESEG